MAESRWRLPGRCQHLQKLDNQAISSSAGEKEQVKDKAIGALPTEWSRRKGLVIGRPLLLAKHFGDTALPVRFHCNQGRPTTGLTKYCHRSLVRMSSPQNPSRIIL